MLTKFHVLLFAGLIDVATTKGQNIQQGTFYKQGTVIRLGSVRFSNKASGVKVNSNIYGSFAISAASGDTLIFESQGMAAGNMVVTDHQDKIIYLQAVTQLQEVVVKANSVKRDLQETQKIYRSKGVFYTGDPHYYYLFLKPMTFIYENFKDEVKNARKFRKYAKKELEYYEINKRFNDTTIKALVDINQEDMIKFKIEYTPSVERYRAMTDYDISQYIKSAYESFIKDPLHKSANPF